MLPWQWILMAAVAAALVILGVLVLAAVAASRSRPRPEQLTPTPVCLLYTSHRPPTICTAVLPAKSWKPSWLSQPPPQTQCPPTG